MLPRSALSSTLLAVLSSLSLALAKDEASLQWAICDTNPQDALMKLGLASTTPPYKENPVTYYDEQPPAYIYSGLMFRTKTNKGQPLSVVKVRFEDQTSDVPDFVECGWNSYGENWPTYTCEKRCPLSSPPKEIWRDEQVRFAQRYESVNWDALHPFGPYMNPKWKIRIDGYKAKFDDVRAEGLHLMEIETKVPLAEEREVVKRITSYLVDRGVVLCERQEGKTMRLFQSMGYIGDERLEL
ncbi:hypothetical protein K4F52_010201 [Lecanicillium sp. MT-2017a]|nr:hypothetical protein K4F52_010201 [Lecanicillium sp. MT-2017a]